MAYLIPKNIEGTHDQLPAERLAKNKINNFIKDIFIRFGFAPIYSSTLERYEFLHGKYGEDEKYFYHTEDESGTDLVLRYDLTVPMLRIISEHPGLTLPLRYYQKGTVWRNRKSGKISFKEFIQTAFAIVGAKGFLAETEIIQICSEMLKTCQLNKYAIRLNNKKILTGFFKSIDFSEKDFSDLGKAIDKFYYLGEETFLLSLKELGIAEDDLYKILDFLQLGRGWNKNLSDIKERFKDNEEITEGLNELAELIEFFKKAGISKGHYVVDFSVAKRLLNYTGLMFEVNLEDIYLTPTIISGGRYDNLMGTYLDRDIPAVGATLSYDRLYLAMKELEIIKDKQSPAKILVTVYDPKYAAESFKLAREIRNNGINAAVYCASDKLETQFKYTAKKEIPYIAILGPKEIKAKKVVIKETKSGREEIAERSKVAVVLKKKLGIL